MFREPAAAPQIRRRSLGTGLGLVLPNIRLLLNVYRDL